MKRLLIHIVLLAVVTGYLIVILGFVGKEEKKIICNGVRIIIYDSLDVQFVSKQMVSNILNRGGNKQTGRLLSEIDLQELENRIDALKSVKRSEVYPTVGGELIVEIYQRNPVVRVIDRSGQGFYIDTEGYIFPLSEDFSPYVVVVSGVITERYRRLSHISDQGVDNNLLTDIYDMAIFIHSDKFWRAQIVQIYVNDKGEFELIPRVGAHIIEFGKADNMKDKFEKLWILYTEGFYNKGWNQYDRINLKYKNQAVCTKR